MGEPAPGRAQDREVVVVGGGLAGIAAAAAAVGAGAQVTLLEATEQPGGQITRQLVAPLDEHPLIESVGAPASYRWVRDRIRAHYRRQAPVDAPPEVWTNPGNGWVSRLCFEPRVGAMVLGELLDRLQATGRFELLLRSSVRSVGRDRTRVLHLDVDTPDARLRLRPMVVVDATELGDLLPLADAPWVTGAEARWQTQEVLAPEQPAPGRTQAITVCAVLRRDLSPGPVVPPPAGYRRLRDTQPFSLDVPDAQGNPRRFGMYTAHPGGPPPFWTYRRLRDAERLGGVELAVINWPGNDYTDADLVSAADRQQVVAAARELTRAFVHWLQTEAPRDDGGAGHPELQLDPVAAMTADGLAADPYVREARRLRARTVVTAEDLRTTDDARARATHFPDSGGVGWYPLDVHAAVGEPASRNDPTRPFQVPLSALVADTPANLVAAGKAIGTTHLSNGAYRVHPVEWASGEAAGVLAAVAATTAHLPAVVATDPWLRLSVQRALLAGGAELAWAVDVPRSDPRWAAVQLLAAGGAVEAPRARTELEVHPDASLDDEDRAAALAAADQLLAAAGAGPSGVGARTLGDVAVAVSERLPTLPSPHLPPVEWS
ncbi:MAG: FAD-dependent oxidoreductase [Nitriliruptoraceae bacterium]